MSIFKGEQKNQEILSKEAYFQVLFYPVCPKIITVLKE
jgi:hypothetical protein